MSNRMLYRAIWIPSALLCAGMGVVFARTPLSTPKPGPMVRYSLNDKSLSIKHPKNWEGHPSGSHGVEAGIAFAPGGDVEVTVASDLQASLWADISKSNDSQMENIAGMVPGANQEGQGNPEAAKKKSPLEKDHEKVVGSLKSEYTEFQAGKPKPAKLAGLEALATEFSGKGGKNSGEAEIQGVVTTALAPDSALRVVCVAPKEQFTDLKSVFAEMVDSLKVGGNGGAQ